MNTLTGQIKSLHVNGSLTLVEADVSGIIFKSIVIETPDSSSYLKVGGEIKILFKETEVIIGTGNLAGISLQNRVTGTVSRIEKGILISKLAIDTMVGEIISIITTRAVEQLEIREGVQVTAMIKTNEIILSE